MKGNPKQHKQVFQDLRELIGKFQHLCHDDETIVDLSPHNLDLKLNVTKHNDKLFVSTQCYESLVSTFLASINITLTIEEFFQERKILNGKEYICLSDLEDEYSRLGLEGDFKENDGNISYLNEKPFFSRNQEQEEWNVQMIDSIICKISQTKNTDENLQLPPQQKRRKHPKQNELSARPFVCDFKDCNSAFKRFEHLKRHGRIHTGERPFKCSFPGCYKKFARSDNLSQHVKIHKMKSNNFSDDHLPFYRNKF